jgi:5-methylcytosine-specific restriction endonuclease McrA
VDAREPRVDLPRAERLRQTLDRDGGECAWCRRELTADSASVDHVIPRLKGGPAWPENEVAACRPCNRARGHTAPADWLADCEARGLEPNRELVHARLVALRDAIAARGGQRRARPYLDAQLRRLGAR